MRMRCSACPGIVICPAAATRRPSGESAMANILPSSPGPTCPRSERTVWPACQSHTRITLSCPAETRCLPSGVKAMSVTKPMCPPVSSISAGGSCAPIDTGLSHHYYHGPEKDTHGAGSLHYR